MYLLLPLYKDVTLEVENATFDSYVIDRHSSQLLLDV